MTFYSWHKVFLKPLGKDLRIHPGISLGLVDRALDNPLLQTYFERIIGLFVTSTLRSQLINIHEKMGTREKSLDNRIVRIIEVQIIELYG